MSDELLTYYNSELTYLRELGAEFAEKYPKVAGRLHLEADKCEDPHVERLLEGFAFLAARIRHKLDDEFPEITDALLGVLYPHFQRPLPSLAVVQFVPGREQVNLKEGFTVPRGSRLNTRPVGGTPCSFVTTYPATLWPISVESARLDPDRVVQPDRPPDAVALLQVGLRSSGGATFSGLALDRLRFYLDGTGAVPSALYEALVNDTCRVVVRGSVGDDRFASVELPKGAIEPVGFGRDEGMFPYPNRSFPGYRLLQEYFTFPEKFLFFDVTGLERIASRGFGDSVELLFFLRRPPRDIPVVQADNFRLGCAPIVNLFPQVAEPIAAGPDPDGIPRGPGRPPADGNRGLLDRRGGQHHGPPGRALTLRAVLRDATRDGRQGRACLLVRSAQTVGTEGRPGDRGLRFLRRLGVLAPRAGGRDGHGAHDLHQPRPAVAAPLRRRAGRLRDRG